MHAKSSFAAESVQKLSHSDFYENLTISQFKGVDYKNQGLEAQKQNKKTDFQYKTITIHKFFQITMYLSII